MCLRQQVGVLFSSCMVDGLWDIKTHLLLRTEHYCSQQVEISSGLVFQQQLKLLPKRREWYYPPAASSFALMLLNALVGTMPSSFSCFLFCRSQLMVFCSIFIIFSSYIFNLSFSLLHELLLHVYYSFNQIPREHYLLWLSFQGGMHHQLTREVQHSMQTASAYQYQQQQSPKIVVVVVCSSKLVGLQ